MKSPRIFCTRIKRQGNHKLVLQWQYKKLIKQRKSYSSNYMSTSWWLTNVSDTKDWVWSVLFCTNSVWGCELPATTIQWISLPANLPPDECWWWGHSWVLGETWWRHMASPTPSSTILSTIFHPPASWSESTTSPQHVILSSFSIL